MAFDLVKTAKHVRGLSHAEFRVFFFLLESANSTTYECYPSIKEIARYTEMEERTVQRHITALANRGLFERVAQRRSDGSRAVNCYRFNVSGTIKVGNEEPVFINSNPKEQPANNGRLHNPPFQTGGGDTGDTPPRQERRDISQESSRELSQDSPLSSKEPPSTELALFVEGKQLGEAYEPEKPLHLWVEQRWNEMAERFPRIRAIRVLDAQRAADILTRGKQFARSGQTPRDAWEEFFQLVANSKFLRGEAQSRDGRDAFALNLKWALNKSNFTKIIEGAYSRDERNNLDMRADGSFRGPGEQSGIIALETLRNKRSASRPPRR